MVIILKIKLTLDFRKTTLTFFIPVTRRVKGGILDSSESM